jgi:hypothetical protein
VPIKRKTFTHENLQKVPKSYEKQNKIAQEPKFLSDLFMGWVMGLEPIAKVSNPLEPQRVLDFHK